MKCLSQLLVLVALMGLVSCVDDDDTEVVVAIVVVPVDTVLGTGFDSRVL